MMATHVHIHVADAGNFEESKHPRATNGQFGSGGSSKGPSGSLTPKQKAKGKWLAAHKRKEDVYKRYIHGAATRGEFEQALGEYKAAYREYEKA